MSMRFDRRLFRRRSFGLPKSEVSPYLASLPDVRGKAVRQILDANGEIVEAPTTETLIPPERSVIAANEFNAYCVPRGDPGIYDLHVGVEGPDSVEFEIFALAKHSPTFAREPARTIRSPGKASFEIRLAPGVSVEDEAVVVSVISHGLYAFREQRTLSELLEPGRVQPGPNRSK